VEKIQEIGQTYSSETLMIFFQDSLAKLTHFYVSTLSL